MVWKFHTKVTQSWTSPFLGLTSPEWDFWLCRIPPTQFTGNTRSDFLDCLDAMFWRKCMKSCICLRMITISKRWFHILMAQLAQAISIMETQITACESLPPNLDIGSRPRIVWVAGRRRVMIPANSVCTVPCSRRMWKDEQLVLVQEAGASFNHLPKGLQVPDALTPVRHGKLCVCIANVGSEDLWMEPRTVIR